VGSDFTGQKIYFMNFTGDITIKSKQNATATTTIKNIRLNAIYSHNQNKEVFLTISVFQVKPLDPGNYTVAYTIKDDVGGTNFNITKDITISNMFRTGITL
jgi:hypothetical protein